MSGKVVGGVIVGWMVLIIGAWLLLGGGGDDEQEGPPRVAQQPTQTTPTPTTPTVPPSTTPTDDTETPVPGTGGGGDNPGSYTPQELEELARTDPERHQQLVTNPEDRDPEQLKRIKSAIAAQPLMQEIPYEGKNITVTSPAPATNGRSLIEVSYSTSRKQAEREFAALLRRYKDSGEAYVVRYRAE